MTLSPEILSLFKKYCNINTSYQDGRHYHKVIELLEPILKAIGFTCQKVNISRKVTNRPNRINLIANLIKDKNLPTLLIYNHIDVVPADYPNAFHFNIKDGRAYARGAADHKGSTIALIDALLRIKQENLRFNLIFLLTTDEETDQVRELKYLEKYFTFNPQTTLCFDPDTFAGGVTTSHLGLYEFKIKTYGKSVHSGMSYLGVNAIDELMALHPLLTKINRIYQSIKSETKSFPSNSQSVSVKSNLNMSTIQGGIGICIVPDKAELSLDLRLAPEINLAKERESLKEQISHFFQQQKIKFEIVDGITCEGYSSKHKEIDKLEKLLKKESNESGQYCVMGSTPVAEWTKKLGIAHFGLGVARYDSCIHGVNENCRLQDLETLSHVFAKYICN